MHETQYIYPGVHILCALCERITSLAHLIHQKCPVSNQLEYIFQNL